MHAPVQPPALPDLPPELLLRAYRAGIFPMSDARDDPEVYWVEPRDRAIVPLGGFRCSRSLRKTIAQERFEVRVDSDFAAVIAACAQPRPDDGAESGSGGSWISERIQSSFIGLHHAGHAHSVECWDDGVLVGGLYGASFDQVFCGESMFSRANNASKVALAWLVALMRQAGFQLLDCQFMTGHLASLGAVEMPQERYRALLAEAQGQPATTLPKAYESLLADSAGASSPGKRIAQSFTQTS